jgi:hypothetical protein
MKETFFYWESEPISLRRGVGVRLFCLHRFIRFPDNSRFKYTFGFSNFLNPFEHHDQKIPSTFFYFS